MKTNKSPSNLEGEKIAFWFSIIVKLIIFVYFMFIGGVIFNILNILFFNN